MSEKKGINKTYLEELSKQIDLVLNNKLPSNNQIMVRKDTPKVLVENGVKNLPMLITQKHIKSIIYTLEEAQIMGMSIKDTNYHGLGKERLIQAIENLEDPMEIYEMGSANYLIVTELYDKEKREIVIPIKLNGRGRYNGVFIDEHQIKSIYGRRGLKEYINKNKFKSIYKKKNRISMKEYNIPTLPILHINKV